MNILVINCGSSSLKYQLINSDTEAVLAKQKISREEAKSRAYEILELVGITPAADRYNMYPFELSGGLLQRVMIAMAMVNNPTILIADEPTTALDVTIQAQILNLMKKMQKDTEVSIIFITHDLGGIAEMCDRVSVMYAGKVMLESMPKGESGEARLKTIPGTPPSLHSRIRGCSFAPRCKYSCDKCFETAPCEVQLQDGHMAACHFSQELFEKGDILNEE